MDYSKATTFEQLANDNCTCLPEIAYALSRANIPFSVVFGMLYEDERTWKKIKEWCEVATVIRSLRNAHIGFLGHAFEGMLDMYSDPTIFHARFGIQIEMLEMCDLKKRVDGITEEELEDKRKEINDFFAFPPSGADPIAGPFNKETLDWSARVAIGLDKLVNDFHLEGLAYYYRGEGTEYEKLVAGMIVGSSILTGRGIPVAGEGDLKNCIAMLIMDKFGAGGSFAELHPADFIDDFVLVGHDGPGHIAISDEKPVLRGLSLYHGKFGHGASVEFKVKTGPITILGLTQTYDGSFKFVTAEGESLLGPIPSTGNTNTRAKFPPNVATFVERWTEAAPTHHFALSVGHNISKIRKLAKALSMEATVVSEMGKNHETE
jgi:L-arabinose isomerase